MSTRTFDGNGNSIYERQFLLDNRCERTHPKRHRTKNRTRRANAKRKQRRQHKMAMRLAAEQKYHAAVRRYWLGEADCHP